MQAIDHERKPENGRALLGTRDIDSNVNIFIIKVLKNTSNQQEKLKSLIICLENASHRP